MWLRQLVVQYLKLYRKFNKSLLTIVDEKPTKDTLESSRRIISLLKYTPIPYSYVHLKLYIIQLEIEIDQALFDSNRFRISLNLMWERNCHVQSINKVT